jgi:hypothetical protein
MITACAQQGARHTAPPKLFVHQQATDGEYAFTWARERG